MPPSHHPRALAILVVAAAMLAGIAAALRPGRVRPGRRWPAEPGAPSSSPSASPGSSASSPTLAAGPHVVLTSEDVLRDPRAHRRLRGTVVLGVDGLPPALRRPGPGPGSGRGPRPLHRRRRCPLRLPQAGRGQPRRPQPRHRLRPERRHPLRADRPRHPGRLEPRGPPHHARRLRQPGHGPAAELGGVLVRLRLRPHQGERALHQRRGRRGDRLLPPHDLRAQRSGGPPRRRPLHRHPGASSLRVDRRAHVPVRGPRHRRHLRHGARPGAPRTRLPDGRRRHRRLGPRGRREPPAGRPGGGPRAPPRERRRRPGHRPGAGRHHHAHVPPRPRRDRGLHDVHGEARHAPLPGRGQPRRAADPRSSRRRWRTPGCTWRGSSTRTP